MYKLHLISSNYYTTISKIQASGLKIPAGYCKILVSNTPDPLLLVTKAIVNLQKRNGFEIAVSEDPEDDYLPSEQSIQAEEEYLIQREQRAQQNMKFRNPIGFDVIVDAP